MSDFLNHLWRSLPSAAAFYLAFYLYDRYVAKYVASDLAYIYRRARGWLASRLAATGWLWCQRLARKMEPFAHGGVLRGDLIVNSITGEKSRIMSVAADGHSVVTEAKHV